jgi:hypothetical protein
MQVENRYEGEESISYSVIPWNKDDAVLHKPLTVSVRAYTSMTFDL